MWPKSSYQWFTPVLLASMVALTACSSDSDDNTGSSGGGSGSGGSDGPVAFNLQLLHFADVDGGRDITNNVVNFSAIVEQFKSEYDNTVVLSSGDNWIPGPEYNTASNDDLSGVLGVTGNGRAHVAWLNGLGVQASALGNHEFDQGAEAIAEIIGSETADDGSAWAGAAFPYLSANLDFTGSDLEGLVGADGSEWSSVAGQVAKSTVITVNGEQVGVVGATTPILGSISSPDGVTVLPGDSSNIAALAAEIQTAVDGLTAIGINKVILLSHMQQLSIEQSLAPLLSDVDIIVGGGSNTLLADADDTLRADDSAADEYPLLDTGADGDLVLLVNTDGDYTYLGRLVVGFDSDGVIVTNSLDAAVNGAWATDDAGVVAANASNANSDVVAVSNALSSALSAIAGNVVGKTDVYLNGERASVRSEETNLGNLTARANLWYAQNQSGHEDTAISIKNGGGIRSSIGECIVASGGTSADDVTCVPPQGTVGISEAGSVSQLDIQIALRFNNGLTVLSASSEELKDIMETGVSGAGPGETPGAFPQIAGMQIEFDTSMQARVANEDADGNVVSVTPGERIRRLVILDDNGASAGGNEVVVVDNGVVTDAAAGRFFKLVTLGFLAGGGDGYPFPQGAQTDLDQEDAQDGQFTWSDTGREQDVLAEYMATFYADTGFNESDDAEDTVIVNVTP